MSEFDDPFHDPFDKPVQLPQPQQLRPALELRLVPTTDPRFQREWQHDLSEWGKMIPASSDAMIAPPRRFSS